MTQVSRIRKCVRVAYGSMLKAKCAGNGISWVSTTAASTSGTTNPHADREPARLWGIFATSKAAVARKMICTRAKETGSVPPNARTARATPKMSATSANLATMLPSRRASAESSISALHRRLSIAFLRVVARVVADARIHKIDRGAENVRARIARRKIRAMDQLARRDSPSDHQNDAIHQCRKDAAIGQIQ